MTTITSIVTQAHTRALKAQKAGDRSARTAAFVAIMNADLIDRRIGLTKANEGTPGSAVASKFLWGR